MFTLSTSATVSSVRASRLLCVSAFSNRMAAMSPLAYVFLLARKPEGGEISFVSLVRAKEKVPDAMVFSGRKSSNCAEKKPFRVRSKSFVPRALHEGAIERRCE